MMSVLSYYLVPLMYGASGIFGWELMGWFIRRHNTVYSNRMKHISLQIRGISKEERLRYKKDYIKQFGVEN